MKQFFTVVYTIAALISFVMAIPLVPANSTALFETKANPKCTWIDGEFEISTLSLYRMAYYKFWIGTNYYEWDQSMAATSNPKKTCHKSGVVCAKAHTQGTSVEVWYAHTSQVYGTQSNEYDYTCDTIERRSENQTDLSTQDHSKAGITGCWSWRTFIIFGCFGEGFHSK